MPLFVKPLAYVWITSGWGDDRSYRGPGATHKGIDIKAEEGTPVYSLQSGKVTISKNADPDPAGEYIAIDHGEGWVSRYLHLSKRLVAKGDLVYAGQLIAYSGRTGISKSKDHLHIDIKKDGDFTPAEPHVPADRYDEDVKTNALLRGIALYGGTSLASLALLGGGLYLYWKWKR